MKQQKIYQTEEMLQMQKEYDEFFQTMGENVVETLKITGDFLNNLPLVDYIPNSWLAAQGLVGMGTLYGGVYGGLASIGLTAAGTALAGPIPILGATTSVLFSVLVGGARNRKLIENCDLSLIPSYKINYEDAIFRYKCDYCLNLDYIKTDYNSLLICPIDSTTLNAWVDKDNLVTFAICITALIGIGILGYYGLKFYNSISTANNTGTRSIIIDPVPPSTTPEEENPVVEEAVNQVRENLQEELIVDLLIQQIINQNEQHSFLREMFQFFRDFLGEISRQIAEILIHLTPAVHNAVIALSHIPNIPS